MTFINDLPAGAGCWAMPSEHGPFSTKFHDQYFGRNAVTITLATTAWQSSPIMATPPRERGSPMPAALRRQLAAVGRKSGIGILRSDKAEGHQSHHGHGLFSLPGEKYPW